MNPRRNSLLDPVHPGWLVLTALVGGLPIAGPLAGTTLYRAGHRGPGLVVGIAGVLLGLLATLAVIVWRIQSHWATLSLLGLNLVAGLGLAFAVRSPYRAWLERQQPVPEAATSGLRALFVGLAGGGALGLLIGFVASGAHALFLTRFFSTLLPAGFSEEVILIRIVLGSIAFALSGVLAGGLLGRLRPGLRPLELVGFILALIWAHHTFQLGLELSIALPGFQAVAADTGRMQALTVPITLGDFCLGIWWSVFLAWYMLVPVRERSRWMRIACVPLLNLSVALTLAVYLGYPTQMLLALGHAFERQAEPERALWCYERGLAKEPDEDVASYLQYRTALLLYKLGRNEASRQALRRVVVKYTANKELVKKASRFLENLERPPGQRKVLPGVDAPVEYKDGYCAPNSLALVMQFWGSDISAATIGSTITGLGTGSYSVDAAWFAREHDFAHDFLPQAELQDIQRLIDAGFPVLVYVPQHVFAVLGYDNALGSLVTYDVATADVWTEYNQMDFVRLWKRSAAVLSLVYPPQRAEALPADIRERLIRLSPHYLHYQIGLMNYSTKEAVAAAHLQLAATVTPEFFIPLTELNERFAGLRSELAQRYAPDAVTARIVEFYSRDYDEGWRVAGQHERDSVSADDMLQQNLQSMALWNRLDELSDLARRLDETGAISKATLELAGLADLARNDGARSEARLARSDSTAANFYAALVKARDGADASSLKLLAGTVKDGLSKLRYG